MTTTSPAFYRNMRLRLVYWRYRGVRLGSCCDETNLSPTVNLRRHSWRACRVEECLANAHAKGFPIVSADARHSLVGYTERAELQYLCARQGAQGAQHLPRDSMLVCVKRGGTASSRVPGHRGRTHCGHRRAYFDGVIETSATQDILEFWPWVSRVPLSRSLPNSRWTSVMQLSKRMVPRVILVEDHGALAGLVTLKDVLRFTLTEQGERCLHGINASSMVSWRKCGHGPAISLIERSRVIEDLSSLAPMLRGRGMGLPSNEPNVPPMIDKHYQRFD
ncbi:hypothetical protein BKA93DRAFT_336335 [Sparassis latifolia]